MVEFTVSPAVNHDGSSGESSAEGRSKKYEKILAKYHRRSQRRAKRPHPALRSWQRSRKRNMSTNQFNSESVLNEAIQFSSISLAGGSAQAFHESLFGPGTPRSPTSPSGHLAVGPSSFSPFPGTHVRSLPPSFYRGADPIKNQSAEDIAKRNQKLESSNRWFAEWEKRLADAAGVLNSRQDEFDFNQAWSEYVTPEYQQWLLEDSESEEEDRQDEDKDMRELEAGATHDPKQEPTPFQVDGDDVADGNFMAFLNANEGEIEDHTEAKGVSSRNFVFDANNVNHEEMQAFME